MEELQKAIDKVNDTFRKNTCGFSAEPILGVPKTASIEIEGDWKHDHAYADYIMEQNGFKIDLSKLKELEREYNTELEQLTRDILQDAGEDFNIKSPKQLGEILFEMNTSVPPKTIKAVKKRTRAGFGKCQGGFCQPLVTKLISEKFNIPLNKVLFQKADSYVMPYKLKGGK